MNQTTSQNNLNKIYTWEQFIADTTGSIENPAPNPRDIAKLKKQNIFKFEEE